MGILEAGKLDRRIGIEKAAIVDDGYNSVRRFEPFKTVWAQVIWAAGKEARAALGQQAVTPTSFRIRWQAALAEMIEKGAADYRVRFPAAGGRIFDIKSVAEIGRREGLELIGLASDAAP